MDAAFDALGDPTRRRILRLLALGEQPVVDVVTALCAAAPISQPAVSQHLKVLREAGLVVARADGRRRLYAVDPVGVGAAQAWLAALADPLAPFAQPLDALATEVARGKRSRAAGAAGTDQQNRSSASGPARRSRRDRPA